jgi:hypothetical protein
LRTVLAAVWAMRATWLTVGMESSTFNEAANAAWLQGICSAPIKNALACQ